MASTASPVCSSYGPTETRNPTWDPIQNTETGYGTGYETGAETGDFIQKKTEAGYETSISEKENVP